MPAKSKLSEKCKKFLKKKISINMREYKQGRFSSRAQAIAVSYSQMRKKYPECAGSKSQRRRRSKTRKAPKISNEYLKCKKCLDDRIIANMRKFRKGEMSKAKAVKLSYEQYKRDCPQCAKYLKP